MRLWLCTAGAGRQCAAAALTKRFWRPLKLIVRPLALRPTVAADSYAG